MINSQPTSKPLVIVAVAGVLALAVGKALSPTPAPSKIAAPAATYTYAIGVLPNPAKTPGRANPDVMDATISSTIAVHGWTGTIRPPASYTTALKRRQLADGYAVNGNMDPSAYELDHLISLELGGHPTDERNLWASLWHNNSGGFDLGMKTKDSVEGRLKQLVVTGKLPLAQAQHEIATDWPSAYKRYVGPWPTYVGGR